MLDEMESNDITDEVNQQSTSIPYEDNFPPLPTSTPNPTVNSHMKPRYQSINSSITQTLVVPLNERRYASKDNNSETLNSQKKVCLSVAQKCNVTIELNSGGNDQNLTVFINGLPNEVQNAKKILSKELQTQMQCQHKVPKEYHKFILGKSGSSLREIENESSTNITVPRANENSDILTIHGTKDGIDKAKFDIDKIVIERSKLATERIVIPKRFYPFICGANNSKINQIRDNTHARVNIPPPTVVSDEIIISGEREGVYQALEIVKKIYEDMKSNSTQLDLEIPKELHRYVYGVRGSGITEIFEKTGVSVEIPSVDSNDNKLVLFGPNEAIAPAISLVIHKSEAMRCVTIEAPNWLHKYMIGKQGATLNKLLDKFEKVHINFRDEAENIVVEGPTEDVLEVQKQLEERVAELKRTMAITELQVDTRFHRHIIGRNGANIQRIQDEYKVQIRMPGMNASGLGTCDIKIEGDPEGVKKAKDEIESMSVKLENEKTKDVILNHKYHSQLIGAQGSKIKELRNQYPDIIIMFPDQSNKCDIVQIRGPRQMVDQAAKKLEKLVQEVIENNFMKEVKIYKQYHKNIIGKGGSNIKKIREETNIRIDFPDEQSDLDVIVLTGKKDKVEEAARRIEAIQAELISVKEESMNIPHAMHNSLIGTRGKIIRCIQEECGGIQIQFPPSDSKSDVVKIRGPETDVDNAKKRLLELVEKKQLLSYQEYVIVKSEFHKFLIGRKGATLTEFKKRHQVMLVFPDNEDTNKDVVQIIGAKDEVLKAKSELEETIKTLENEVEKRIKIEPKWHKHFFQRRQAAMEEISRDFGGVKMYFPKIDATENIDEVRIVGPKGCIEAAIGRIDIIIENLAAQTSIAVFVEQKHHRNLLTRNMSEIKNIQNDFDVSIKFPSRELVNAQKEINENQSNGNLVAAGSTDEDESNHEVDETNPINLVTISGRKENCSLAKEALDELVPIAEEVPLANEFHRNLIGQKGQGINTFSSKHNVIVNIPQANKNVDYISIKGPKKNIEEAKEGLNELIKVWEEEKIDRIARNFEVEVDVPIVFHRNIIGQRGTAIDSFRNKFNVNIQMPDQNSGSSIIIIRGYEEDALKAKEELCSTIKRLEAQVKEEMHIPKEVHPLLIGTRGFNLRKLREQFKVEIVFPNKNGDPERANCVEVIGDKADVDAACDHLIERANELLEEFEERNIGQKNHSGIQPLAGGNNKKKTFNPGFVVAGAPWQQQVPDARSNEEFPSMDAAGDKSAQPCLTNGHSE